MSSEEDLIDVYGEIDEEELSDDNPRTTTILEQDEIPNTGLNSPPTEHSTGLNSPPTEDTTGLSSPRTEDSYDWESSWYDDEWRRLHKLYKQRDMTTQEIITDFTYDLKRVNSTPLVYDQPPLVRTLYPTAASSHRGFYDYLHEPPTSLIVMEDLPESIFELEGVEEDAAMTSQWPRAKNKSEQQLIAEVSRTHFIRSLQNRVDMVQFRDLLRPLFNLPRRKQRVVHVWQNEEEEQKERDRIYRRRVTRGLFAGILALIILIGLCDNFVYEKNESAIENQPDSKSREADDDAWLIEKPVSTNEPVNFVEQRTRKIDKICKDESHSKDRGPRSIFHPGYQPPSEEEQLARREREEEKKSNAAPDVMELMRKTLQRIDDEKLHDHQSAGEKPPGEKSDGEKCEYETDSDTCILRGSIHVHMKRKPSADGKRPTHAVRSRDDKTHAVKDDHGNPPDHETTQQTDTQNFHAKRKSVPSFNKQLRQAIQDIRDAFHAPHLPDDIITVVPRDVTRRCSALA